MKKDKANPSFTNELTVGEVATQSGVAVSAIQFYESKGLIGGRRTAGSRRRYPREVLKRVVMIKAAQRAGIPLSVVREILMLLPKERTATAEEWSTSLSRCRQELDKRIARFVRLRDDLACCIGCGCLSLDTCPLVSAPMSSPDARTDSGSAPPAPQI